jgi:hypothetical protein
VIVDRSAELRYNQNEFYQGGGYVPVLKEAAEEFTIQVREAQKVIRSFADLMSQISEVEAVLGMLDDRAFSLWSVTDEVSLEVEDRIYEMEGKLMDKFPGEGFDFHLIERRGRPLEEIVSLDRFAVRYLC